MTINGPFQIGIVVYQLTSLRMNVEPHPLPALLLATLFSRSLTLVPRSFLLNRTETLATQANETFSVARCRRALCADWLVCITYCIFWHLIGLDQLCYFS